MFFVTRYKIKNNKIKPYVKFIWRLEAENTNHDAYKLLPSESIDIIINLSSKITYTTATKSIIPLPVHINAIRNKSCFIKQRADKRSGKILVYGISFYPYGLFSFFGIPIDKINNKITNLNLLSEDMSAELEKIFRSNATVVKTIGAAEKLLEHTMELTAKDLKNIKTLKTFTESKGDITVEKFCIKNHIALRTFERMCKKYTGCPPPKILLKLLRFKNVSNTLIHEGKKDGYALMSVDYNYHDQAHFIKDFKYFSESPPEKFVLKKNTVKKNTKYMYK